MTARGVKAPLSGPGLASLAVVLGVGLPALGGCVDPLLDPEPGPAHDPVLNFDLLWQEFDRHYSFFLEKGVDWDETYERYRPRVGPETSPRELFEVISEMLDELRDGHVDLVTPFGQYGYVGWREGYPENFDRERIYRGYLSGPPRRTSRGPFVYGRLGPSAGYIHIEHFGGDGFGSGMEEALEGLEGISVMVLDIRGNRGGSDLNLDEVAGRFADRKRLYRYVQYRNGPAHDDFTDLIEGYVEPRGSRRFRGPVAVLTNRLNFSTAEDFVLAMQVLPDVVVVGDTTGGGMGNPISRELPNGWVYRLSRWRVYDSNRTPLPDGQGLIPDSVVQISEEDAADDRDTILETALELLDPGG